MPRKRRNIEENTAFDYDKHSKHSYDNIGKNAEMPAENKIYNTAIYARLSSEDLGGRDNRISSGTGTIENQILLVQKYIESKPHLKLCEVFADNGQTGTNFERAGFQKLMEAVKRGKINCIVVKDLSRFGRHYIETGDYLEKIFPFMGVRFISVNNGYDSHNSAGGGSNLSVTVENLMNDLYAKDISRKVKSAFKIKQQKGEFVGNFAPYGYMKDPKDRHKLIIDEETAPVVRNIYKWKSKEKLSNVDIVRRLNQLEIIPPVNYLYSKNLFHNEKFAEKNIWNTEVIKNILRNPAYIGHMAQGKTATDLSLGIKRKKIEKKDWIIIKNTHEPIIEEETFQIVSEIMEIRTKQYFDNLINKINKTKTSEAGENIFLGLLECASCGKRLFRKKCSYLDRKNTRRIFARFICPQKYNAYDTKIQGGCKSISEKNLRKAIFEAVQNQISLLAGIEKNIGLINSSPQATNKKEELETEKQGAEQKLYKLNLLRSSLYDDFKDGVLSEKEYNYTRSKYEDENNLLASRLHKISGDLKKYSHDFIVKNKYAEEMRRFSGENELSREMLTALVEKIIVHGANEIEIIYKYGDEIDMNNL